MPLNKETKPINASIAQSTGAVKYTDCTSAEA